MCMVVEIMALVPLDRRFKIKNFIPGSGLLLLARKDSLKSLILSFHLECRQIYWKYRKKGEFETLPSLRFSSRGKTKFTDVICHWFTIALLYSYNEKTDAYTGVSSSRLEKKQRLIHESVTRCVTWY